MLISFYFLSITIYFFFIVWIKNNFFYRNDGIKKPWYKCTCHHFNSFKFFILLNLGLSPADIVFKILNCFGFFLFSLFVSLELIAKPSKAALVPAG